VAARPQRAHKNGLISKQISMNGSLEIALRKSGFRNGSFDGGLSKTHRQ
jgi:hypothetical protein